IPSHAPTNRGEGQTAILAAWRGKHPCEGHFLFCWHSSRARLANNVRAARPPRGKGAARDFAIRFGLALVPVLSGGCLKKERFGWRGVIGMEAALVRVSSRRS